MTKTINLGVDIKQVAKEVATRGSQYLSEQYNKALDPNIEKPTVFVKKTSTGYAIVSQGKDVIYEEFGTGDKGQQSPHPDKSKYNLNAYNSGRYIRDVNPSNEKLSENGITSGKYWTYEKDGRIIYTQGIPAGKEMFNTVKHMRNSVINDVLKEKASDVLSKL